MTKQRKWMYAASFYGKRIGAIGEVGLIENVRVYTIGEEPDYEAARNAVYEHGYEHLHGVRLSLLGEVS